MDNIQQQLKTLTLAYAKELPQRISEIEGLWESLNTYWDSSIIEKFHRALRNLESSAGTYGYVDLAHSAKKLDTYFRLVLKNSSMEETEKNRIAILINELKSAANTSNNKELSQPSVQLVVPETVDTSVNSMLILDEDINFFKQLSANFDKTKFHIKIYNNYETFLTEINKSLPLLIVVDVGFLQKDESRVQILAQISNKIPLFVIANDTDVPTRLIALRSGSTAFFSKPVNMLHFIQAVDKINPCLTEEGRRVLIVDDCRSLAEYYALILRNAGVTAKIITDPLKLMTTLSEFQPDVILTNVTLPKCSGLELAAILRQDYRFMHLPIVYICEEEEKEKHLGAFLISGSDDILIKPIAPLYLIAVVNARLKWGSQIGQYLSQDSLTGLLNHSHILQRLEFELLRAKRQNQIISFAKIDIDYFKTINDDYGHLVGDLIIQRLARFLVERLRRTDIIGRYAGDEFFVIFPNTTLENAAQICSDIRELFSEIRYQDSNYDFYCTISVGLASYPQFSTVGDILEAVDKALTLAKTQGRNQIRVSIV